MSRAKIGEPIEMPFGLWTPVGSKNHMLEGGYDPQMPRGNFEGKGQTVVKYRYSLP